MHSSMAMIALGFASAAQAHIALTYPAPFRASYNPFATNIDYSITSPLAADGSNYPCKGYLSDLGTPAGAPTASFVSGQAYNFTTGSGAVHGGGSCQAALSYDKGATFQVIHSYIGSCPIEAGQSFDFTIPADAPASGSDPAIFAWTWFNEIGNREMYMDCAAVTITGGSAKARDTPTVAFSSRPGLFLANIGNGCTTVESVDAVFPNPGPDVTTKTTKSTENTITGNCAAAVGGGSESGGSSPSAPAASSAIQAPSSSASSGESSIFTVPVVTSTQSEAAPTSVPGGVFVTVPSGAPTTSLPGGVFVSASSAASSATPTTLTTAYLNSTTSSTPTASAGAPGSTGSAGTGVGIQAKTPCTNEGDFNCVEGTSFQQCASGSWSVIRPLAPGTSCSGSMSSSLNIAKRSRVWRPQPVRRHL
ncbi:extracellular protein [Phlyctema vagabunda]|uniref:Extracellular protein n=1 Tax=Phlyctema vagabunda TaxID=108571 RepID=A0ABR4PEK0_9HELO